MQQLLVSVRGKNEALEAARGGAHIVDVEFPASALGTPYPLNIRAVRQAVSRSILVSTNIGEKQSNRGMACQAAVGVAVAGADIVKAGLGELTEEQAARLGRSIVRSVQSFVPQAKVVLAFFADLEDDLFDPTSVGIAIASSANADGVLLDTFEKSRGLGLMDHISTRRVRAFVRRCHTAGLEAWVAGSITHSQIGSLWQSGVDVVCVRQAACAPGTGEGRFAKVTSERVQRLVATIPR